MQQVYAMKVSVLALGDPNDKLERFIRTDQLPFVIYKDG